MEVAAVAVPDRRLGELPSAVVTLKKGFFGKIKEEELVAFASKSLPRYAVPVMVIIQEERLERNPAGKIVKTSVRKLAAKEWEKRKHKAKDDKAKL